MIEKAKKELRKLTNEDWLVIGGAFVLLLVLRWNSFGVPFERDEGEYAYSAWMMSKGGVLYKNAFLQKPPLIIYMYRVGQLMFGHGLWVPRLLALLFVVGTMIATATVVAKEYGKREGLAVLVLLPIMLSFPFFMGLAANTEVFMLLPLMGVVGVYVWLGRRAKLKHWVLAGGLAAVALLFKPICVFMLVWVFGVWLVQTKNWVGILVAAVAAVLTGVLAMVPVILAGGWEYFWEEVIVFNGMYASSWGFGLNNLFGQIWTMASKWWILIVPIVWFFVIRKKEWWFWTGLLVAGFLGVYQTPIGHYYLMLMPVLAILAGVGLVGLMDEVTRQKLTHLGGQVYYWGLIVVVVLMLVPVRSQFGKTPEEIGLWIYGSANPFVEAVVAAEKLEEITEIEDRVFVAGSEPEILYYAKRLSMSRFVITYPLIIETQRRLEYQTELIGNFEKTRPEAIVYSTRQHSGLWNEESPKEFIAYLDSLVENEYELRGAYVWGVNKGYWLTDFEEGELERASLLLYKRKG